MNAHERLASQLSVAAAAIGRGGEAKVPVAGRLLWRWFADLCGTRTYHASGPNPISFAEIAAYAALHGWPMRPDHIQAIRRMDDAFIAAALAKRDSNENSALEPFGGSRIDKALPITPAAFDAVFS